MGYRMTGQLFLLCYLKFLSFPNFLKVLLFFIRKKVPRLPVVRKRKAKDDQSEYMAGQIWEAEDKMGIKACYGRQRRKTSPTADGWL